ncbi:MAG TPA: VOC family protein, partial [Chloroflexota bacterium]|nr:VOC family protein [Chloroflexota bacterium]
GAFISIWQPQMHQGAEVVNDPNSFSWSELYTRDMPAAQEFYRKVFNWETEEAPAEFGAYTIFRADGRSIAGGLDMTQMLPDSVPPHWLVYFTVEDAAAAAEKIKELGGTVVDGPHPTPMGPIVIAKDPVGALFALVQFTNES